MPISADRRQPAPSSRTGTTSARSRTALAARASAGFTLLEIMATVALVGLLVLPMLEVREQATARAYKASRMNAAMDHAERLLVKCMSTVEVYDRYESPVELDPQFTSILTLEEFDVSTGLTRDEADDMQDTEGEGESLFGAVIPGDAGGGELDEDDEERNNPHLMRRFRIRVEWLSWDGEDDESHDHVDLEGYLPRIWEREQEPEDADR
ncbi:MAG: hypothetical protein DRQ55_03515 [Planctomycetota bacterium]|nr:MAG: hypothetical protein DRQ55_03515 [Planctomycetota bacterium]